MPKKATPARSGVQRTKPKGQKSFELVRPIVQERETEETITTQNVVTEVGNPTAASSEISSELAALPTVPKKKVRSSSAVTEVARAEPIVAKPTADEVEVPVVAAAKGSASARLAARKNTQRSQQRSSISLVTAEHYSYVRRDLAFIAILAAIMFIAIIVLYFVLPGVGV